MSATVAVSPLFTTLATGLAAGWLMPVPASEIPNLVALIGVGAVVGGSALCALGAAE